MFKCPGWLSGETVRANVEIRTRMVVGSCAAATFATFAKERVRRPGMWGSGSRVLPKTVGSRCCCEFLKGERRWLLPRGAGRHGHVRQMLAEAVVAGRPESQPGDPPGDEGVVRGLEKIAGTPASVDRCERDRPGDPEWQTPCHRMAAALAACRDSNRRWWPYRGLLMGVWHLTQKGPMPGSLPPPALVHGAKRRVLERRMHARDRLSVLVRMADDPLAAQQVAARHHGGSRTNRAGRRASASPASRTLLRRLSLALRSTPRCRKRRRRQRNRWTACCDGWKCDA